MSEQKYNDIFDMSEMKEAIDEIDMEERSRLERETRIREEMLDKMRKQEEIMMAEMKVQQFEKKKKDKHQEIVEDVRATIRGWEESNKTIVEIYSTYLNFVLENKVLYSSCHKTHHRYNVSYDLEWYNWLYISDKRVGFLRINKNNKDNKIYIEDHPFYFFEEEELNKDHICILDQMMHISSWENHFTHPIYGYVRKPLGDLSEQVVVDISNFFMFGSECDTTSCMKKFETIIRLIPGEYKNGSWKALDGFFGVYFNRDTLELSKYSPK